MNPIRTALAIFLVVSASAARAGTSDAPFHCYLTWQDDPTTTVTVNFHTLSPHAAEVRFDTVSHGGSPSLYPNRVTADAHTIPGLDAVSGGQRYIHTAELTGLAPDHVYYFVAGSPDGGYTAERSVRLPSRDIDALRFVDGGDMAVNAFVPPLLQAAADESPRFAVLGGDLAYEDGALANYALWDQWLANWEANMITPEGYTVPMIVTIGNHEVVGGWGGFANPTASAPFFFGLFAQDGHGFGMPRSAVFRRDIGPDMSLLVLDSGHVTDVAGAQADWIAEELSGMKEVSLRMAAYHVPMYPSERSFNEVRIVPVRTAWRPIFDAGALDLALEHHDHMLKRTKPLRDDAPDPDGTIYLGDGCFGQTPRTGVQAIALEDPANVAALGLRENYLASWAPARHFWLLEVDRSATSGARVLRMSALDATSAILDSAEMEIADRGDDGGDGDGFTCASAAIFARVPGALSGLRNFRDTHLLTSAAGTAFADAYYRMGGPIAQGLNERPRTLEVLQAVTLAVSERKQILLLVLIALCSGCGLFVTRRKLVLASGHRPAFDPTYPS